MDKIDLFYKWFFFVLFVCAAFAACLYIFFETKLILKKIYISVNHAHQCGFRYECYTSSYTVGFVFIVFYFILFLFFKLVCVRMDAKWK